MRKSQTVVPSDEQVSDFASRLREYMNRNNLRQSDIAELCVPYCEKYNVQIPKNAISQYIQGKAQPNQNRLRIISKALGVSEIWLLGYSVPLKITEAIDEHRYVLADNIEYDFSFVMPDDSMNDKQILRGDIVFCKSYKNQQEISYGDIVSVLIDNETTAREFTFINANGSEVPLLIPSPSNLTQHYGITVYDDNSTGGIQILGKAVAILGKISSRNTQSHKVF